MLSPSYLKPTETAETKSGALKYIIAMEELLSMDVDFEMPYTKEEMQNFSKYKLIFKYFVPFKFSLSLLGTACSLMKNGEFDKAIPLFCDHLRRLLAKKDLCSDDQKKMDTLKSSLELTTSYLQRCRQSSLDNTLNDGWVPVTELYIH